jgi:hypothetical protein
MLAAVIGIDIGNGTEIDRNPGDSIPIAISTVRMCAA